MRKLFNTVRGRYGLTISITLILSFVLLSIISLRVVIYTVENRGRAYMASGVEVISSNLEQEYTNALQITQQMVPEGILGQKLIEIIKANDMYEKYEAQSEYKRILNAITFVSSQPELCMYWNIDTGERYSSNFNIKTGFEPDSNEHIISETKAIAYHAPHTSQAYGSGSEVISVARKVDLFNDMHLLAYVEVRTSCLDILYSLSENAGGRYSLYFVDKEGKVGFTSDTSEPKIDKINIADLSNQFGRLEDIVWSSKKISAGFYCVLVQAKEEFYYSVTQWLIGLIIANMAIIAIDILAIYSFKYLVLKKMEKVISAIDAVDEKTLEIADVKTDLEEYDILLDRFSLLLGRIRLLINELSEKEKEKNKFELETLYYRINPHFLLNSLNSVYWCARIQKQNEISSIVYALTVILRYSLGKTDNEPTLRSEIDVVKCYIKVESHRHTFDVVYDIDEGSYLDMKTPKLILQPIVENSINHGMGVEGHLIIHAHEIDDGAIICVEDDGIGIPDELLEKLNTKEGIKNSAGIGLRYVNDMLENFYEGSSTLLFGKSKMGGTIVTVTLHREDNLGEEK